nr:hypothetical protein [Candidatus Sigynarchaeota archaeon]
MDTIILKCPNCSAILPAELKKDLYAGKDVTCENCGILIIPKTPPRGEVPPPSRISPRNGFTSPSTARGTGQRPQEHAAPSRIVPSPAPRG